MNRFLRKMPIRRKVTFVILLTCITALLLVGIALFAVQVFSFRQNFTTSLHTVAEIIESNSTAALAFKDREAATEILASLKARGAVTYASIDLPDGTRFAEYQPNPHEDNSMPMPREEGIHFQNGEVIFTEQIVLDGEPLGLLHIHADYTAELHRILLIYGGVLLAVLTLAILLAFLLSARLRRSISDPILGLAKTARSVSQNNDYSVRAQKFDEDEIGTFTDAFNQMLEQIGLQSTALRDARDSLEARVAERTAMLQKTNKELTIATAEAAAANRAKSEFLSRMSHELRTPMNAILGFAQLLELKHNLTSTQADGIKHILKAGHHLLALINEVLDISRIEAGNMSLSFEPVDVRNLAAEALDLVRPVAAKMEVELQQAVESEFYVCADQQRLKQTLLNLLSNAVKYNRAGGKVSVHCELLADKEVAPTSKPQAAAGVCRISVADTGIGIPAEKLKRLFTPFDRLDAERTDVEGTGLGLAVTKKMVELMGGTIGIKSAIGEGTTFWIDLPRAERPAVDLELVRHSQAEISAETSAQTVVYIEDNLSNLKVVEAIFGLRSDVKLLAAMQGQLGLTLIREHSPDLVLLDLNLPDMNGQEVLERLRAEPRTRDVPVMILTADASPGRKERLLASGATSYVTKPFDIPEFLRHVDAIFARSARAREARLHPQPSHETVPA